MAAILPTRRKKTIDQSINPTLEISLKLLAFASNHTPLSLLLISLHYIVREETVPKLG